MGRFTRDCPTYQLSKINPLQCPKFSYLLKFILFPILPNYLKSKELIFTPAPSPIPKSENAKGIPEQMDFGRSKVELLYLNTEETQNIINACKKKKSSTTAFINQVAIEAVSKITGINKLRHLTSLDARKCISSSNPIIRNNDPRKLLGFFTSIFDSYYNGESTISF